MIGKPRLGGRKLNVRFDEGELEIEHQLLRQLSTLPKAFTINSKLNKEDGIINLKLKGKR